MQKGDVSCDDPCNDLIPSTPEKVILKFIYEKKLI